MLTPHDGEYERLAGHQVGPDRVAAAIEVARTFASVVLLKGSSTVVASPSGAAWVAVAAPPEMATAGSGDVLAGFLGSLLAHHQAVAHLDDDRAAWLTACAAHVHGVAGAVAVGIGRPVAAADIVSCLPTAVARVRGWAATGA